MTIRRFVGLLALAAAAGARPVAGAEVAVLKTSEVANWRARLDALHRAAPTQTFTEYDLRGDKAEADRVVATLKGKGGTIVVGMGPLAAQAAREGAPELPLIYCMVQDPAGL